MSAPNKSIETKQPLVRLAFAVADSLEDQSTPASLKDSLREVASSLIDELSGGNGVFELRALAQFVDGRTRPETESTSTGRFSAKNGHQNHGREALAKAATEVATVN
ncbi:MAG TPA: hypothetical protein VFV58_12590 [Blastocatellia bacterium]|jgi:hypothetical protein|nr:hypothetical protein [Blastocatellia bacterium]